MVSLRLTATRGAAALMMALIHSGGGALAAAACDRPSFSIPSDEFYVEPAGRSGIPRAIASGAFFQRSDQASRCDCDLAVAVKPLPGDAYVAVLRGNEGGAFSQAPGSSMILDIPQNPEAIASGRFSGGAAGLDDILVLTTDRDGQSRLTLFRLKEDGSHERRPEIAIGRAAIAIATGHFDDDQHLDVAVLSRDDRRVIVLLGDGDGNFPTRVESDNLGARPHSIAVGRFGGSSAVDDVAVATIDDQANISVKVLQWNASGALTTIETTATGDKGSAAWIAAADQNLAVGFWSEAAEPVGGSVKILPRSGNGTFGAAQQTLRLDARPQLVRVADMNDDGVPDLVVSAYGDVAQPQSQDGIRIFKGIRNEARFVEEPMWRSPPSRASPLAVGKFGARSNGLVVGNLGLNSVSTYLGNGTGIFVKPQAPITPLPYDARMLIVGDFHTVAGDSSVLDLAYLRFEPPNNQARLFVMLNNAGYRTFELANQPIELGRNPLLIAAGKFDRKRVDDNQTTVDTVDIAIIDANEGDQQRRPLLRILFGEGEGRFRPGGSEFLLDPDDKPKAMITGHFRGQSADSPLDIAIVSDAADGGKLTLFYNYGDGSFPPSDRITERLPYGGLGAVAGSAKFRGEGRYDFVIKVAESEVFMFLASGVNGEFTRKEIFSGDPNDFVIGSKPEQLLVGDLNGDGFDDVIMIDSDLSFDVFINDGAGRFTAHDIDTLTRFAGIVGPLGSMDGRLRAESRFFLEDFGAGKLGLAALLAVDTNCGSPLLHCDGRINDRASPGQIGIVTMKGDGQGGFADPRLETIDLDVSSPLREVTTFLPRVLNPGSVPTILSSQSSYGRTVTVSPIKLPFTGRFANVFHGNNKPDLGFLAAVSVAQRDVGQCSGDQLPNPSPLTVENESGLYQVPRHPFCEKYASSSYAVVFGNTCND